MGKNWELPFQDIFGAEIQHGDIIVYPHAAGSSGAELRFAKVIRCWTKRENWQTVNQPRITIHGVDESYDWQSDETTWTLRSKKSCIMKPGSCVVLRRDQVLKEIIDLLDTVEHEQ